MKDRELTQGCKDLLRKLIVQRRIGGRHTPEIYVMRWIRYLSKDEYKLVLEDWNWCKNEGLVIKKPKSSELHVSLNPRRLDEIYELIN